MMDPPELALSEVVCFIASDECLIASQQLAVFTRSTSMVSFSSLESSICIGAIPALAKKMSKRPSSLTAFATSDSTSASLAASALITSTWEKGVGSASRSGCHIKYLNLLTLTSG